MAGIYAWEVIVMGKRILHPREMVHLSKEAQGILYEMLELGVIDERELEDVLDSLFIVKQKELDEAGLKKVLFQKFSDRKLALEKFFYSRTIQ